MSYRHAKEVTRYLIDQKIDDTTIYQLNAAVDVGTPTYTIIEPLPYEPIHSKDGYCGKVINIMIRVEGQTSYHVNTVKAQIQEQLQSYMDEHNLKLSGGQNAIQNDETKLFYGDLSITGFVA